MAVEGDIHEIRYWHLLGLLLAAMERWTDAADIFERGSELGLGDWEGELDEEGEAEKSDGHAVHQKDFGMPAINGNADKISDGALATVHDNAHAQGPDSRDLAATTQKPDPKDLFLLDADATEIPESSRLLMPMLHRPPLSKLDVFEYALQLRMSQGALTEVIEGPEGAEAKWLEVFSWVAQKRSQSESV